MSQRGFLVDRCPRCSAWMPRATAEQHAVLQSKLEDVAMQVQWPPKSGQYIGPTAWWELIVAAYDRLQKSEAQVLPAIDGRGFDGNGFDFVRGPRRRRKLNGSEIGEIIEYTMAWGSEHGVTFRVFEPKKAAPARPALRAA